MMMGMKKKPDHNNEEKNPTKWQKSAKMDVSLLFD